MKWDRKAGGRTSPTDLDQPKPAVVVEFDVSKQLLHGWPTLNGKVFGPTAVHRALAAGYYVLARILEVPDEVPVQKARMVNGGLQVLSVYGWRFPVSLRTINPRNMKGIKL